jgi:hypothetical protein
MWKRRRYSKTRPNESHSAWLARRPLDAAGGRFIKSARTDASFKPQPARHRTSPQGGEEKRNAHLTIETRSWIPFRLWIGAAGGWRHSRPWRGAAFALVVWLSGGVAAGRYTPERSGECDAQPAASTDDLRPHEIREEECPDRRTIANTRQDCRIVVSS